MKLRIALMVVGLLGIYAVIFCGSHAVSPGTPAVPLPPFPSSETQALAGVWEGLGPADLPIRLVVEEVHVHWASVLYTWGEHPDGRFQKGWVRARARVHPNGKLFWLHPGEFTFQLSEDWTILVGKREDGGKTAYSLMRRVPSGVALNIFTPPQEQ